jgi:hypothetical protein
MTQVFETFSIIKEKEKQDKEFLDKIQVRNEKEAKLIICKYDLNNSCLHIVNENLEDYDKMVEEYQKYLQKRKEFFNFISEYL